MGQLKVQLSRRQEYCRQLCDLANLALSKKIGRSPQEPNLEILSGMKGRALSSLIKNFEMSLSCLDPGLEDQIQKIRSQIFNGAQED